MSEKDQNKNKDPQAKPGDDIEELSEEEKAALAAQYARQRKAKDDGPEEDQGSLLWLVTFADAMALMLTFFVLLYSMSRPDAATWEALTQSLKTEAAQFQAKRFERGAQQSIRIDKIEREKALDLSYLGGVVSALIEDNPALQNAVVSRQRNHLLVSLPTELLFEGGQAEVNVQGKRALYSLGEFLARVKNRIEVVGHADPNPVPEDSIYSSNWHLSLSRALSVAAVLENTGYSRPILVQGFSSARFDELPDSIQGAERRALSRRVDIKILRDSGKQRERRGLSFE